MEKLGSGSLPKEFSKFVRDGEVIVFDNINLSHAEIAKEAGLGKPTGSYILGMELMEVDDAGAVNEQSGELCFSSSSSSCELRGDPVLARATTLEVAANLTGMPVQG